MLIEMSEILKICDLAGGPQVSEGIYIIIF